MENYIPPIIHYCWFGGGGKDIVSRSCLKTWKKGLSQYKILEWNENNTDISHMPQYVQEAYNAKKYAFVSDYVRLLKMYEYGGIYLDTDMEFCRSFDDYLKGYKTVLCFFQKMPMTAFFASVPHNPLIEELLKQYQNRSFVKADGSWDLLPIDFPFCDVFLRVGLIKNGELQEFGDKIICYPNEYFCGINTEKWKITYTPKTCMVHHSVGSWENKDKTVKKRVREWLVGLLGIHLFAKLFKS